MTKLKNIDQNPQLCQTAVVRGILNISLEEISKDMRSLTRIANLALDKQNLAFTRITNKPLNPIVRKFNSNDLYFNYLVETENKFTSNDTYITITHKKRNHFIENWKIYIFLDDLFGIKIKLLSNVNYTLVNNSDLIGKFIKSKKWVNSEIIDYEIRKLQNQIDSLNSIKGTFESFCC
jgi:hypothetical protein